MPQDPASLPRLQECWAVTKHEEVIPIDLSQLRQIILECILTRTKSRSAAPCSSPCGGLLALRARNHLCLRHSCLGPSGPPLVKIGENGTDAKN